MITLEVNGIDLTGFTSIDVTKRLDTIAGNFSFTAVSTQNINFPVKMGDHVRVMADTTPIITGYAEYVNVSYDASNHYVTISGRDVTADLIDSMIGEKLTFTGGVTFDQVVRKTLDALNMQSVGVISEVPLEPLLSSVIISSEIGQKGYDFLSGYARQLNLLLITDGDGNVVITRSSNVLINTNLLNIISTVNTSNPTNNILSAGVTNDSTGRYGTYIVRSGQALTTFSEFDDYENIDEYSNQITDSATQTSGTTVDVAIRPSRVFEFQAEHPSGNDQCAQRAIWEANYRRAKSFDYYCTVQGHNALLDNFPWRPNLLVKVIDDFCDINANLLIEQVRFTYSVAGGTKTQLTLVTQDAYQLQTNRTDNDALANKQSPEFVNVDPNTLTVDEILNLIGN